MGTTIVGIDCATAEEKTGLALAELEGRVTHILELVVASKGSPAVETAAGWIGGRSAVLIALDAPLGWPAELGQVLSRHEAGCILPGEPDMLFRRATDRDIKRRLDKQPLDVGADRIARTAHAALRLLDGLRATTGLAIPLAWHPSILSPCAIEVYPAATLAAHWVKASGYKGKAARSARRSVLRFLADQLVVPSSIDLSVQEDHALDALLCVVAGVQFLRGEAVDPKDSELPNARKEGWIWAPDRPGPSECALTP